MIGNIMTTVKSEDDITNTAAPQNLQLYFPSSHSQSSATRGTALILIHTNTTTPSHYTTKPLNHTPLNKYHRQSFWNNSRRQTWEMCTANDSLTHLISITKYRVTFDALRVLLKYQINQMKPRNIFFVLKVNMESWRSPKRCRELVGCLSSFFASSRQLSAVLEVVARAPLLPSLPPHTVNSDECTSWKFLYLQSDPMQVPASRY